MSWFSKLLLDGAGIDEVGNVGIVLGWTVVELLFWIVLCWTFYTGLLLTEDVLVCLAVSVVDVVSWEDDTDIELTWVVTWTVSAGLGTLAVLRVELTNGIAAVLHSGLRLPVLGQGKQLPFVR